MKNLTLSLDISTTATGWAVFHGSDLVQSGVLKHKSKSFFERGRFMASELRAIQSRALQKYNCHFESIVVEKNSVMGPNQQSMISIGIVTGIILGRLIADILDNIKRGISELEQYPEKYVQYEPENRWGTVSDALEVLKSLKECILEQDIDTKYLYMRW